MYDVAVVIPTIIRPHLERAVKSVFEQDFDGTIQILIGLDYPCGNKETLWSLQIQAPKNMAVDVLNLGYSTRIDKGGLYYNYGGGALRSILTLAANARYVAYLDDDCWFKPNHISSLMNLITKRNLHWVYSKRRAYYSETGEPVPEEKVGKLPEVDTNCILFDKIECHDAILGWVGVKKERAWNGIDVDQEWRYADPMYFTRALSRARKERKASTNLETTCYGLSEDSPGYHLHHKDD